MNSFGRLFRISIYGESHNDEVGIIIDGCPAGIELNINDLQDFIDRRKPNQKGTTTRKESDIPIIKSGIFNNRTTGTPIIISFKNEVFNSSEYDKIVELARPGHSDFTNFIKYKGFNNPYGGGHSSGRLTVGIVAAGYFAKKILQKIEINAKIIEINGQTDFNKAIDDAISKSDSVGGIIECRVKNLPVGLGEPFFDSAESVISHLLFSIPAIKGVEFGAGFNSSKMYGSEMNDSIIDEFGKTKTNNSGGINGGISNGNELIVRVAVKPTSSITILQQTINLIDKSVANIEIKGRHDVCIALRIPVIIESVIAIGLADLYLLKKSYD